MKIYAAQVVGCPGCRLRFPRVAATSLPACPECGLPPKPVDGCESLMGFRLLRPQDTPHPMPEAMAVALPGPAHDGVRSTDRGF